MTENRSGSGKGGGGRRKGSAIAAIDTGARRGLRTRVKSAKGRKISSTRWLDRQLNDPYVQEARRLGYRSRAAFKLIEINNQFDLLRPGMRVVDLGAAPGGWTQVAVNMVGSERGQGQVVGLDIAEWEGVSGATCLQADFLDPDAPAMIKHALQGPVDAVISDMSPPTTGHRGTDHIRIIDLVEHAIYFAEEVLAPDGIFIAKVFKGGTENDLLAHVKKLFRVAKHAKPPSSRAESPEMYLIATGFRGQNNAAEDIANAELPPEKLWTPDDQD
ncbi:RlmE family RNA methyltransferase [Thalassospira sp.]|uniref:RlmE family RNA methyltransferase n=1 Tax=Thalassospira sp. TaxID=1912094 RepID=UPI002735A6BB|nr:RlmE family RNA methyltransferase [Thalassospira sp.]MDP2697444.1 RlmE family RNA methyltransferase [Thalassospira sp.]